MDKEIVEKIARLEQALERLKFPEIGIRRSTDNVSNPPTDAECTAAFGAVTSFYDVGIIDDNNLHTTYWLVLADNINSKWLLEQLTIAA